MPVASTNFPSTPWVIKPLVPDEVYTDRTEFLEYFYEAALKAASRRTMSTVLLGRRWMGKTEIFRRVVNRLFFEQDPHDPKAVVPVYYSFSDDERDPLHFATNYLENFMRYYIGFYTQQPEIVRQELYNSDLIAAYEEAKHTHPDPASIDRILYWYDALLKGKMTSPTRSVVAIPRRVSDIADSTIVVFLDEFQNTHLPQNDFRVVGSMQEAVESNTCPHFVTGSAMSILAREILGRGSLFGRFDSDPIKPLSEYWGAELALNAARYYQAEVSQLIAPVVATRCGGNPFYIVALIRQAAKMGTAIENEETINSVLAVDISSGFIWAELYDQVNGWIERLNEHGITKWILYLSALEEERKISLERIQRELKVKEGKNVSLDTIRNVLIRLSRGDLLEYRELGGWFHKVDDPILVEFLKVWGRVDVEGQNQDIVRSELDARYRKLERWVHEYKGYLAEVFMAQVLLSNQNRRKQPLPGQFFNSTEDIELPPLLHYLNHRVRLSSGKNREVDIFAAFTGITWICQSKWVTTQKMGIAVLQGFLEQAKAVQAEYDPISICMWLFAHEGLTQEAEAFAQEEGILWSNREQLDGVLRYLDLRSLPELDE
ncbi:hypothetical protein KFU94_44720 [Chloroflexi bacterium TSY]|nr:hypothetical protein [Chloroflexi bacterium TSY]